MMPPKRYENGGLCESGEQIVEIHEMMTDVHKSLNELTGELIKSLQDLNKTLLKALGAAILVMMFFWFADRFGADEAIKLLNHGNPTTHTE